LIRFRRIGDNRDGKRKWSTEKVVRKKKRTGKQLIQ